MITQTNCVIRGTIETIESTRKSLTRGENAKHLSILLKKNQQPLVNQGDITMMENMPIDNIYSLSYSLIIKGYKVNICKEIVSQLKKTKNSRPGTPVRDREREKTTTATWPKWIETGSARPETETTTHQNRTEDRYKKTFHGSVLTQKDNDYDEAAAVNSKLGWIRIGVKAILCPVAAGDEAGAPSSHVTGGGGKSAGAGDSLNLAPAYVGLALSRDWVWERRLGELCWRKDCGVEEYGRWTGCFDDWRFFWLMAERGGGLRLGVVSISALFSVDDELGAEADCNSIWTLFASWQSVLSFKDDVIVDQLLGSSPFDNTWRSLRLTIL